MSAVCVDLRVPCRFCRKEWELWLSRMLLQASRAEMLPGQKNGLRPSEYHQLPAVELVVSSDGEIAAVNAVSLGCSGPTNVLSFPGDGSSLGSLFLSADTMEREIFLYGQDPVEHARRLLAHGLGHIAGFDHGPRMDAFCAMLEACCRGGCS